MRFIFDLDGTIVFGDNRIEPAIADSLHNLKEVGHTISFASARAYRDCLPVLGEDFSKEPVIALNGAKILEAGNPVKTYPFPQIAYREILKFCLLYQLPLFVDSLSSYAYQYRKDIGFMPYVNPNFGDILDLDAISEPLKCVIFTRGNKSIIKELDSLLKNLHDISFFYHEIEHAFYINRQGVNKGQAALEAFSDPYICFGNDKNDLELFQAAQLSVQIGNYPDLKTYANSVIDNSVNLIDNICQEIERLAKIY